MGGLAPPPRPVSAARLLEVKRIPLPNVARVPPILILEKVSLASIVEAARVDRRGIVFGHLYFVTLATIA